MLPPSVIDVQGATPRDLLANSRGLRLSTETMYAELRAIDATTCRVAACHDEFDETIRTVSEPECTKRRIEPAAGCTGSTRSVPDGRQGFSKGSASLQSLVRRRSRRHGGGGSSLPLEVELSTRQEVVYPVPSDFIGAAAMFRNDEEARNATPTSTLVYAISSAQASTSRTDNGTQDISSSASNVATVTTTVTTTTVISTSTTGSNATSPIAAGRFGNAAVSLLRTRGIAKPAPFASSSWNGSGEKENCYIVDPVKGNTYYKGQFLGKVGTKFSLESFLMTNLTRLVSG